MAKFIRKTQGKGRWAKVMDWQILAAAKLGPLPLAIITIISMHTNKGGTCRLYYKTIGEMMGLTAGTVGRGARQLEMAGLVEILKTGRSPIMRVCGYDMAHTPLQTRRESNFRHGAHATSKEHPSVTKERLLKARSFSGDIEGVSTGSSSAPFGVASEPEDDVEKRKAIARLIGSGGKQC